MVRIFDFRQKEVINISDGKRLGYIVDAVINEENGTVSAFVIPAQSKVFGIFGKESECIIPWEDIRKIGEDIVLVEYRERL